MTYYWEIDRVMWDDLAWIIYCSQWNKEKEVKDG